MLANQQEVAMTEKQLPEGVHVLSPESQAVLARAAEKGAAITARHTKRAS